MYSTYNKIIACFSIAIFALGINEAKAQSSDKNYIRTRVPSVPLTTEAALDAVSGDATKVQVTIQYLDGLGRPLQSVQVKGNPDATKDIVTPVAYDQYGRETTKYLPYAAPGTATGNYRSTAVTDQLSFYAPATTQPGVVRTPDPYAVSVFEASPENAIIEQGFPGTVWKPAASRSSTTGRTLLTERFSNTSGTGARKIRLYKADNPNGIHTRRLNNSGWYTENRLLVKITKDENWLSSAGTAGTTEEYTDNEGRVLLKRIWKATNDAYSTYYVYDDYGNLCYVLPPGVNPDGTTQLTQAQFDGFCYQYRYDSNNRLIEKKVPGKGWEYMVYNKLDQVVATQDSVQRMKSPQQASFTKYDAQGRVAMSGFFTLSGSPGSNQRAAMQIAADANSTLWESRLNAGTGTDYSNSAYPTTSVTRLQINYYDSYSNIPSRPSAGAPAGASTMLAGLLTASRTYILNNTSQYLWQVLYYDNKGQVITTYRQHYKGGTFTTRNYDLIATTYDFTGQVTTTKRKHYVPNSDNTATVLVLTVDNRYIYDHMGRKLKTWQTMTNAGQVADTRVLLSRQEYNEIGQLRNKYLHTTDTVANNYKQKMAYSYNPRGWLLRINDPDNVTALTAFGMQLSYNEAATDKQFNGNIAFAAWQTIVPPSLGLFQQKQTFKYTYDKLNRLENAGYSNALSEGDKFNEELTYDKMGNILTLKRKNDVTANIFLNSLTYEYTAASGNKLVSVADVGTANQDGSYTYDGNGNVITDTRNQITSTTYT